MAYKVFTNGSVLQASEVNDNLMKQAVAVFSNAAARTAAITSPVAGQLTYLEDSDRYFEWNGSAWISPFGATLLARTVFTAQSEISFNNVFNSQFENYEIYLNTRSTSGTVQLLTRMRLSGTNQASGYLWQELGSSNTTVFASRNTSATSIPIGAVLADANESFAKLSVSRPATAIGTSFQSYNWSVGIQNEIRYGVLNNSTVYDGISFITSAASVTGEISIYGMRK